VPLATTTSSGTARQVWPGTPGITRPPGAQQGWRFPHGFPYEKWRVHGESSGFFMGFLGFWDMKGD